MQTVYRYFGDSDLDYSEEAAMDLFLFESRGIGDLKPNLFYCTNGYANGKHWLNVTVAMWREDIAARLLRLDELYNDPDLQPFHWWLDSVFKKN